MSRLPTSVGRTAANQTVGGQAVLEGVMMRSPSGWAVAVRTPAGQIEAIRHPLPRLSSRSKAARVPLVRGVLVLGESLTLGFRALSWSAQKSAGDEEEPLTRGQMAGTMTLAVVLFIGLFIALPGLVAGWVTEATWTFNVADGVLRLALIVGYIALLRRMPEFRRLVQYHGAEHMTIHAFEAGEPLSVDTIRRHQPEHPRCGTNFLLLVAVLAFLAFSLIGRPGVVGFIASRLLFIPVIAGVSYEILRFSGLRADRPIGRFLAAPGMWLQKLTTSRPDDSQIEVAVASLVSAVDQETLATVQLRGPLPAAALAARPA